MGLLSDLKDAVDNAEQVILQGYAAEARPGSGRSGLPPNATVYLQVAERVNSPAFAKYLAAIGSLYHVLETCPPRVASTKHLISKARTLLHGAMTQLESDFILLLRSTATPPTPEQVHAAAKSLPPPEPYPRIPSSNPAALKGGREGGDASGMAGEPENFNDGLPSDAFLVFPNAAATCLQTLASQLIAGGREESCLGTFAQLRKAFLDGAILRLCEKGQLRPEDVHTAEWDELEARVLTWQTFAKIAVRVLLVQERKLCSLIFKAYPKLPSRCFGELAQHSAALITGFAESFALDKRLPERLFSMLDCYETLQQVETDFCIAFHGDGRECVRLRGEYSAVLKRVGLSALGIFSEFEVVVERDVSKVPIGGPGAGAVPRPTSYVLNYLSLLYEYRDTLMTLLPEQPGTSGRDSFKGGFDPSHEGQRRRELSDPSLKRPGSVVDYQVRTPTGSFKGEQGFLQRGGGSMKSEPGLVRPTVGSMNRMQGFEPGARGAPSDDERSAVDDPEGTMIEGDGSVDDGSENTNEDDDGTSSTVSGGGHWSREFWADGMPEYKRLASAVHWKLEVLRSNFEAKAKQLLWPRDPALAAVFLMNNMHYIARKVKDTDLRRLLGDDWIRQQAYAVRGHAESYMRFTWGKLANSLRTVLRPEPLNPAASPAQLKRSSIKHMFKQFNTTVEEVHRVQSVWLVTPGPLRDELRTAIKDLILPLYTEFYEVYSGQLLSGRHPTKYVKFDPFAAKEIITDLFSGGVVDQGRRN